MLLKLKKKEHTEKRYPFDGKFYLWDHRYYEQKLSQSSLDLGENLVKEYFPVSVIVQRIIKIYENLLSIKFVEMGGKIWDPGSVSVVGLTYGTLSTPFRGPTIFRLEGQSQGARRLHWILLPGFIPKK